MDNVTKVVKAMRSTAEFTRMHGPASYPRGGVADVLNAFADDVEYAFEDDAKDIEVNAGVLPAVVITGKGTVKMGKTKDDQLKYADSYRNQIDDMVHIMDILKCRIDSMKYLVCASNDGSDVLDQMKNAFVHLSKALIGMHLKQQKHKEAADAQGAADANVSTTPAS